MSKTVRRNKIINLFSACLLTLGFSALFAGQARSERLPLKTYTSADGLASSAVTNVFRDSLGFLWFCTRDGISRFDGSEFTNYRLGDEQSARTIFYFYETRDGYYWIVSEGLYRV